MAALTPAEQRFLVLQLAVYTPIATVVEAFEAQFGKALDRRQVWEYDCSKAANRERRSTELVELFEETRAEYQEETKAVAIGNKRWRLEQYQDLYDDAKSKGLRKTAMQILEQAAKEDGDAYTNKRDVTSGGQPFKAVVGVDIEAV